jgi:hypothetical protein
VPGALLLVLILLLLLLALVSLLMKGLRGGGWPIGDTPAEDAPLADVITEGLETMPIDTPATGDLMGTPAQCGYACMQHSVCAC